LFNPMILAPSIAFPDHDDPPYLTLIPRKTGPA